MRFRALLFLAMVSALACSNPFAPKKYTPGDHSSTPAPPATTPEILMDNLHRAMRDRDKDLYETLLDRDFWFTETDCQGDLVFANDLETELALIGGSRDGSKPGIFDVYRTFEFDFQLIRRSVELGIEHPEAFPGDPDGHPDEDWEVFYGRVQMMLLDESGDGYRVDQTMTYKLRRAEDGLWKIIRWIDDPLAGDCSPAAGKESAGLRSWAAVKERSR